MIANILQHLDIVSSKLSKKAVNVTTESLCEEMCSIRVLEWDVRRSQGENLICRGKNLNVLNPNEVIVVSRPSLGKVPRAILIEAVGL